MIKCLGFIRDLANGNNFFYRIKPNKALNYKKLGFDEGFSYVY